MHYMNPFEFAPLPDEGPCPVPKDLISGQRLEGYLTYSLKVLTPLHITGRASKNGKAFGLKSFYQRQNRYWIPGSSIRGMLSTFIEALTGSDLRAFTRGDEASQPYAKCRGRHVGFLMASENNRDEALLKAKHTTDTYTHRGQGKTRCRFERNNTLPPGFGENVVQDAARFLFGYVQPNKNESDEPADQSANAHAGRLIFEDLEVPKDALKKEYQAWDLNTDGIMGGPNPRANTAWYFTPGEARVRKTDRNFRVWEILADKVRGRKFYFHQDQAQCHRAYREWKSWMRDMQAYKVQAIAPCTTLRGGRIYFHDLPEAMLPLLAYAVNLENGLAHKLGALKPFGYGSIQLQIEGLYYKNADDPFTPLQSRGLKCSLDKRIIDPIAYKCLKQIMRFPDKDKQGQYLFLYPPFNTDRNERDPEKKGFALVERVYDRHLAAGNVRRKNCVQPKQAPNPPGRPSPGKSQKVTLFFDHYQKKAVNFKAVMGGEDYSHLLAP